MIKCHVFTPAGNDFDFNEIAMPKIDENWVIDEPWDEITAEYWPRIQSGELTIKAAYEEHDRKVTGQ